MKHTWLDRFRESEGLLDTFDDAERFEWRCTGEIPWAKKDDVAWMTGVLRLVLATRTLGGWPHALSHIINASESPLEWIVLLSLLRSSLGRGGESLLLEVAHCDVRVHIDERFDEDTRRRANLDEVTLSIETQKVIGKFRVDFLITMTIGSRGSHAVVVECDGHDYHERTKEQAARDRSRDRALQAAGLTVLRFTGSELWKDPFRASTEALDLLRERCGERR